jgi:arginine deiminase
MFETIKRLYTKTHNVSIVTNAVLKRNGVKVFEIRGSELSRGRGGPRCMSVPIVRSNM